jgi:hypothetical protein
MRGDNPTETQRDRMHLPKSMMLRRDYDSALLSKLWSGSMPQS